MDSLRRLQEASTKPSRYDPNHTGGSMPLSNNIKNTPEHPGSISIRSSPPSRPSSQLQTKNSYCGSKSSLLNDNNANAMAEVLHLQQQRNMWKGDSAQEGGVVMKQNRESYTCCPESLRDHPNGLFDNIKAMNVRSAITLKTRALQAILNMHPNNCVPLTNGLKIQILPTVEGLLRCQKHQNGAFIRDQELLIVWDADPENLLKRAAEIENALMETIWLGKDDKTKSEESSTEVADNDSDRSVDLEKAMEIEPRPTNLLNPVMIGVTMFLLVAALGLGFKNLAVQIAVDGSYKRLGLLVVVPCQVFVSLFFMQVICVSVLQLLGPIKQLTTNSKFHSGKAPPRTYGEHQVYPHVTIQMPVYKEGLRGVISPTIKSLKEAISTYELQGGAANILANDDGMQVLPEAEAEARRDFYEEHGIGWVARPKHNPQPENDEKAFLRRGRFKKASNMNYSLMISNKVEDKLLLVTRHSTWTQQDEDSAYQKCLSQVLEEEEGRAWAEGNIRIGDYILLIDCDTRVPTDCLLDAAMEMEQSPEVGILQFSSGVMQVTDTFFENGITFFTNLIYTAIKYTVACGDVAPFVGHNAMLRWSAVQEVSYQDEDGYEKFWSESHVSEDFNMSLQLQCLGYLIRLASYTGDGFKEGVSLTVYDELNRWEKYAYGCNELLFNPFRFWVTRGPLTPLFLRFIMSNIRLTSKISLMAYIGTYYAIGAAWLLTLMNYFLYGWYNGYFDHYYLDSFKVYVSLIVVFSLLGNVALAWLRYRLSEKSLLGSLCENFKWTLLLSVFLGGISLHVSQALLCHFFEIDITWGSTSKEAETISFFEEIPRLLKRFKFTFLFCFASMVLMVIGATAFPLFWEITDFVAIYPLATVVASHFLLPIALNPALMMFTW